MRSLSHAYPVNKQKTEKNEKQNQEKRERDGALQSEINSKKTDYDGVSEEVMKRDREPCESGLEKGKEIYAVKCVQSFVYSLGASILHGEDKETQLRITLRWRLMGGNKKGHRVATAAPTGENFPLPHDTVCRRRGRSFPTLCRTYFSYQARSASSAFGDLRIASGPRRAEDQTVLYHSRISQGGDIHFIHT